MINPMTAATILIKHGLIDNMKSQAMEIAKLYGSDLKIELNISKEKDIVRVNISEYNL